MLLEKIFFAGISQGFATAIAAFFEDTPKRFAGLLGLCSRMPVESHTKNYQRSEDTANIEILTRHAQHLHPVVIRSSRSTPVFLSHSVDDNVVPIKLAENSEISFSHCGFKWSGRNTKMAVIGLMNLRAWMILFTL